MFQKGISGNPNGRKRGSRNKAPKELSERVKLLLDENWEKLQSDLDALTPGERVKAILKLMEFCLPKQAALAAKVEQEAAPRELSMKEAQEFLKSLEETY